MLFFFEWILYYLEEYSSQVFFNCDFIVAQFMADILIFIIFLLFFYDCLIAKREY